MFKTYLMILLCRFNGITYFVLRGLCPELEDKVDNSFVVDMDTADNKRGLVFTGFTKTMMLLDPESERWTVISLDDGSVIMELDSEVIENNSDINYNLLHTPEKVSNRTIEMEHSAKHLWRRRISAPTLPHCL